MLPLPDETGQDVTQQYDIGLTTGQATRQDESLPSQKISVTYTCATPAEDIQSEKLLHKIGRRVQFLPA